MHNGLIDRNLHTMNPTRRARGVKKSRLPWSSSIGVRNLDDVRDVTWGGMRRPNRGTGPSEGGNVYVATIVVVGFIVASVGGLSLLASLFV